MTAAIDPAWRDGLLARAQQPPRAPRVPLRWDGRTIGSIEPALPLALGCVAAADGGLLLCREGQAYTVQGPLEDGLARLARALRAAGLSHVWRDEQLAVCDDQGLPLASVERAVVRVLGIATRAVHLVGFDARGHVWLQQRAFDKANDPGKWDTLMGGMVGARDTLDGALERETWEEAGLRLEQVQDLEAGGWLHQRRPADDGTRHGYLVEDTFWSRCVLPDGVVPENRDGEVERFDCLAPAEVADRLQQDAFTDEAAMILLQALGL